MAVMQAGVVVLWVFLLGLCRAQLPEFVKMPYEALVAQPLQTSVQRPFQQGVSWSPMYQAQSGPVQQLAVGPVQPVVRLPLQQGTAPLVGLFGQPALRPVQQVPAAVVQGLFQNPVSGEIGSFDDPLSVQSLQVLQGPEKKLTWHFPQTPQRAPQLPVQFEIKHPVRAASVAAFCGENMVRVEVKKDLFGSKDLISPLGLTLGGCAALGEDSVAQVLIFEAELQACNSVLKLTEDELVYTFTLHYDPQPLAGTPIVRVGGAVTGVECHYPRQHNVSSNAILPLWIPYAATKTAEELLVFYLRLMTDDWQFERPSNQYFLGDFMNIEASVEQFNHVPLRVFVDSCVATAVPDVNSVPRYSFIENYGCLVDAKLTRSGSRFMPRVQPDKLQFQLEAFMFQQPSGSVIYLTCLLKATAASVPTDAEHKACSFTANGWTAVDGNDQICGCCDTSCGSRKARSIALESGMSWKGRVALGPILIM